MTQPVTGYERQFYARIDQLARNSDRIMQAIERIAGALEQPAGDQLTREQLGDSNRRTFWVDRNDLADDSAYHADAGGEPVEVMVITP